MLKEAIAEVERLSKDAHAAAILKELPKGRILVRQGDKVEQIETPRMHKPDKRSVASLESLVAAIGHAYEEVGSAEDQYMPVIMIKRDLTAIIAKVGDRTNEEAPEILIEWQLAQLKLDLSPLQPNMLARLCRTEYFSWMPAEIASRFDSIIFETNGKVTYRSAHGGDGLGRDVQEKVTGGGGFGSTPVKELEVSIPLLLEKDLPQRVNTKLFFEYDCAQKTIQMVWTQVEKMQALQALASEVEHTIRTALAGNDAQWGVLISG